MKPVVVIAAIAASLVSACGEPTVIDQAKKAYLPDCPGHSLGKIVNGYYIASMDARTLWTAYPTDDDAIVRITAEGPILYAGIESKASLEVLYASERDELTLSGLTINGRAQAYTMAEALVSNMCDKAKGL